MIEHGSPTRRMSQVQVLSECVYGIETCTHMSNMIGGVFASLIDSELPNISIDLQLSIPYSCIRQLGSEFALFRVQDLATLSHPS